MALAIVLLAGEAAQASCTPASASNVTATCTGTTTNQGGGAPGTSAGTDGYGTGTETGVTVTVDINASVTGTSAAGIFLRDATVTNNTGASITGGNYGIDANSGVANVTNSGSITGTSSVGIFASTNATVTNNTGASITGGAGIQGLNGFANIINSGSITGTSSDGIYAFTNATVTNNAGAIVTGSNFGVFALTGSSDVTNSGSITGTSVDGIYANTSVTVTNNTGATVTGASGIFANTGLANVTNSGSITGTSVYGIYAGTNATVTNNVGASITGGQYGIFANAGVANITNSGSITGTSSVGIFASTNATVTNNTGASITGGAGIQGFTGFANIINSGSITGTSSDGIYAFSNATVTNNAGAIVTGSNFGVFALTGSSDVTNSGSITGTSVDGIYANTSATVINNTGATVTGGTSGIFASTGLANVTNSGSITGTSANGIYAGTNATVINNTGATVMGGQNGIAAFGFANVTNFGSITGGQYGIIVASGGSSVFNAGTISGGTAGIRFAGSGNTLTLAPGSVITGNVLGTGSDTFQLGGTGVATFDISQLGPTAQYQGFGTFNKIDSSVWTLTGTSSYAGPVNVNGGTLSVNGNIASASSVTVNAGATLGGNGIVGNTTINGGMLAPGNSIGTLTVSGSLVFTAAAAYLVEVSGTSSDLVKVTGAATLGGTVRVTELTNSFRFNSPYTILTSTGLGGSQFNALTTPNGIAGSLVYSGNNVLLNLTSGLSQLPGLNINQHNVATALDTAFNAPGTQTGPIGAIFLGNIPQNLTQASGEIAAGSQQTTFDAMTQFMGLITDPLTAGRGLVRPSAPAFAEEDDTFNAYAATGRKRNGSERDAYGMITKAAPPAPFEARWNVWAAGFGGSQTTDGNAALGSNTATSRIGGVAVGADYWLSPRTVAGFALAGGGTNFSIADGLGGGRSDLFQAGAFIRHTIGSAYITAAAAYGWQDITTDRTVTISGLDQLRAEFNANAFSGRVEGGYRFVSPWMGGIGITPYAAGQFTTFDLPAYSEQAVTGANTFALAYASRSVTDARSEIGLRSDKSYAMEDGIFTLRARAAWAHDFNPDRSVGATFQALPGASFVVNGAAQASDSALVTASAEKKWLNGWSAVATFEGEFSNVTRSYAGKGVVRYAW
jgi:uncharacterized protein with beta-barrel porin domain